MAVRVQALAGTLLPGLLEQLVEERASSESAERRAALLHEEASLKGLLGDIHSAISAHLEAADLIDNFVEPRLAALGLCEEHLPERIGEILDHFDPIELAGETRSHLLQYAALVAISRGDFSSAHAALNRAFENDATEPTTWLLFEIVAIKLGDDELHERALSMQAAQTSDVTWKALLQLDAARASERLGALAQAQTSIRAAASSPSEALWPALLALEQLGIQHEQPEVTADARLGQANLIIESLTHASAIARPPEQAVSPSNAAYLLIQTALCQRALGQAPSVLPLLDRALALFPEHPGVLALALAEAGLNRDHETCKLLSERLLALGGSNSERAAWWLHIAASAFGQHDPQAARAAAREATRSDPNCLLAEALEFELERCHLDAPSLVSLLERAAHTSKTEQAKQRFLWRAAETSARLVGNVEHAQTLLGPLSPDPIAATLSLRIQRFLASVVADKAWFAAVSEKLASLPGSSTDGDFWFESLRNRALKAPLQLSPDSSSNGEATLLAWLVAYGPHARTAAPETQAKALEILAGFETDPDRRHSYMLAAALRACLGARPDVAQRALTAAEEFGYAEPVASLMGALLHQKLGDLKASASSLRQLALGSHDLSQATALLLHSGLCSWHGGDRKSALDALESGEQIALAPSLPLLRWARRQTKPDDPNTRRQALDTPTSGEAGALTELERFTFETLFPDRSAQATEALERFVATAPPELHSTSALAQALWSNAKPTALGEKLEAFERLEDWGEQANGIARSAAYYAQAATTPVIAADIIEAAERWVHCDPTLLPALEWLFVARQAQDLQTEARARQTLAARLHGSAQAAFETSGALLNLLLGQDTLPQLTGTDVGSRLTALELAPPGSDPRRRASALAHAADLFGDEGESLVTALAGYNLLALGDVASAEQAFQVAAAQSPEDVFVWEGLRAVAELTKNRALLAEAYAGLGDAVVEDAQGALYWEKSSGILLDELHDAELGEHALARAVARDIGRSRCFDRLFRIVREQKDHPRLLVLIEARLTATDDVDELSRLFWERARALRTLQQLQPALLALESVTLLEPDHVGALALAGEIFISQGEFAKAAEHLATLAALPSAPSPQRLMSGVAAVDIYENKLNDSLQALLVLTELYRSGLSTLPVRERLARAAASASAWEQALDVLEDLSRERETPERRAEAARLCLVICRDKLKLPDRATRAAERLLKEQPADAEALELVLSDGNADRIHLRQVVAPSRQPLIEFVLKDPLDASRIKLLQGLARALEDPALLQVTLGALTALGEGSAVMDQELLELDANVGIAPRMAMDAESVPDLLDPEDAGSLPDLLREAAISYGEILGPTLQSFGVGKKQRIDPRQGLPIRNEIAAWAGALQLGEFELYVGGEEPDAVRGLAGEPPILLIGTSVVSPLSTVHRQAVAREIFAVKRGTSILTARDPSEVAALIAATCQTVGVSLGGPTYALTAEFVRLLSKGLGRKQKKTLPALAQRLLASNQDTLAWINAALSSMDRVAALAAGDISWVVAKTAAARGKRLLNQQERERLRRLLTFALAPRYLKLRQELALGVV